MTNSSEKIDLRRRSSPRRGDRDRRATRSPLRHPAAFSRAGTRPNALRQEQKADIGFVEIDKDITLRRMVVRNPRPERDRSLPAWVSGDAVRLEGHCPCPRRRLRSPRLRLAGLRSFIAADGRQVLLRAQGLRARSEGLHTQGRHRHIEAHDLRNGHRRPAGASPGSGKARHREDDHRRRLRAVQQAAVHVREPAKPEGGTFDGPGPRPAEQESRRNPRKRVQKRPAQGSAIRGVRASSRTTCRADGTTAR